jgi:G3E family GTPase
MSLKKRTPLFLISGFLGAGKTTFINNLFDSYPDKKFGIIVNDFGEIGIDASIIKNQDRTVIKELNNGQIFCSCLAGSFIETVAAYSEVDIDFLLVETSGLAKPSPLLDIISAVKEQNGDKFEYRGMISLVDTGTYLELSKVLNAVDEQIHYSDLILMNKIDMTDARTAKSSEMKILSINPSVRVIRTEYGRVPENILESMEEKTVIESADRRYAGWGDTGRPVPLYFKSDVPVSRMVVDGFIDETAKNAFRIKGGILTDDGVVFVDCTTAQRTISSGGTTAEGLVIILPADDNIVERVKKRALEIFNQVS